MLKYVGPKGLYLNIKWLFFLSNQGNHLALVWYGDMYSSSSTPEVHGRASAGIDVLESSSYLCLGETRQRYCAYGV